METAYLEFLRSKIPQAEAVGFEPLSPPNPGLSPHATEIALWAARGGRRAVFASFGLHKTRMNLQIAWWVTEYTGGRFLIVAPLGVRQEFTRNDGPAMGIPVHFVRTTEDVLSLQGRVFITNYESVRDGKIDLSMFAGAGLDEASVLRSYGSKTYQEFLPMFRQIPYRFVFTATPSPNRYKELIHYAAFLGIMDSGEALTRFFQRDSGQAGNLTLYPHMEQHFWNWLASWSVFIQRPSDLGFSDEGYDLPEIDVQWHRLEVDHSKAWDQSDSRGQCQLILDQSQGLKEAAGTKRESIDLRIAKAREVIDGQPASKHWLIWHDLEDERRAIEKAFPDAVTAYGSQDLETREDIIVGFADGRHRILGTKPSISGSGCNFQRHCANAVFLGVGYKFNDFIQAIHRIHRFGQKRPVTIHIIYLASEDNIVAELQAKWRRHETLVARQTAILREYRLSTDPMKLLRSLTTSGERQEVAGQKFRAIRNDCVLEAQTMEADSVDFICTSIPFGNQYEYSPSFNDFGHNTGDEPFFEQMDFLIPELLRITKPGRIAAIHVKDRIQFGNVTGLGCPTVNPFSDMTVAAFRKHGWLFMARITIDTDVVRENAQTYRLGWSENAKDSSKMGAGMPEYVLIFRKLPTDLSDAYADQPVTKSKEEYTRADWQIDAAGLWRSDGNRLPDPDILRNMTHDEIKRLWISHAKGGVYNHEAHVAICKAIEERGKLPSSFMLFPPISRNLDIWTDIARIDTLNSHQSRRNEEKHVCPLQLDLIKRLITRYTNPGEFVWDPFLGIGSVAYQALKMDRYAGGTELGCEYWRTAVGYCEAVEAEITLPTLFDLNTDEGGQAA